MQKNFRKDPNLEILKIDLFSDYETTRKYTGTCPKDLSHLQNIPKLRTDLATRLASISKKIHPKSASFRPNLSHILTMDNLQSTGEDVATEDLDEITKELDAQIECPGDADLGAAGGELEPVDLGALISVPVVYPSDGPRAPPKDSPDCYRDVLLSDFPVGEKRFCSLSGHTELLKGYLEGKKTMSKPPTMFVGRDPVELMAYIETYIDKYIDFALTNEAAEDLNVQKFEEEFYILWVMVKALGRSCTAMEGALQEVTNPEELEALNTRYETMKNYMAPYAELVGPAGKTIQVSRGELVWSHLTAYMAGVQRTNPQEGHIQNILRKINHTDTEMERLTQYIRGQSHFAMSVNGELKEQIRAMQEAVGRMEASFTSSLQQTNQLTAQVNALTKTVNNMNFAAASPTLKGDYKIQTPPAPTLTVSAPLEAKIKGIIAKLAERFKASPISQAPLMMDLTPKKFQSLQDRIAEAGYEINWHNMLALSPQVLAKHDPQGYKEAASWYRTIMSSGIKKILDAVGEGTFQDVPRPAAVYSTPSGTYLKKSDWLESMKAQFGHNRR